MTAVRITGGVLNVDTGGGGSVDNTLPGLPPGFWGGAPLPGIDNSLPTPPPGIWPPPTVSHPIQPVPPSIPVPPGTIWPPVFPVDPGYGLGGAGGGGRPVDPGFGIGEGSPDQGLPPSGEQPSQGLPGRPERPSQGLPPSKPGGKPDQGLPQPGRPVDPGYGVGEGSPDQSLPKPPGTPGHHPTTYWVVCGIPGVGWRYIAVDPTLVPPRPQPKA